MSDKINLPKNEVEQSPDGTIRPALQSLCTDAVALNIAQHIVEVMRREADQEQLDFDFHVNANTGGMQVTEQFMEKNVWFRFDVKPNTLLAAVKKVEFLADCNIDELDLIDDFHRRLCRTVKDNFASEVEAVLRERMFQGKAVPIKLIEVTGFEMIDFSNVSPEENMVISIEKHVPAGEVDQTTNVSSELYRINAETGKGFNAIVREKQAEGDPNYKYVKMVHTKKMLWECEIDFFVDFSSDKPIEQATRTVPHVPGMPPQG